ncbi:DNA primase [Aromatoleum petrolei]|uniref:DNA primase n=1 Tax=Aromatoleum petrolei TaxID=76116 RepID=A0ABX1MNH0_9RHOO|nr:DNA primase [Aromatoleum petrolei]NMF87896.1 DNA primase [Aromatoleum petrolei]QTQ35235.1 DNA primase [Aromatoleum petrolei]
MIPQSFIQDLLARVDIVDVVERHLTLKKSGANYFACCPFHGEKSASFSVSPSKQFYHCFGCGAHGSAVGFLMEYTGLSFVEAVKELASYAGLQVPQENRPGFRPESAPSHDGLIDAMAAAARFYRDQLKSAPAAIDYLKRRGVSGEIAARFGIGFAPDDWQALRTTFPNYDAKPLLDAGLVIENDAGRRYDRFRNRIMFPIQDRRGRIIAFGGRVLDAGEPKYLNSPETPLFEKGRELYGFPQAQKAIRDAGYSIVVEGYMDVVALAQFGVANAVATLGTATTPHHINTLLRQSQRIVFCFDGDNAGRKAARRALESALEALRDDVTLAFLFLPQEHDPDSFVRAYGAEAFNRAANDATPLTAFLLNELRAECPLDTAEGRARLVHDAKPLVTRIAAPMLRLQIIKAIADASGFSQGEVESAFGLKRQNAARQTREAAFNGGRERSPSGFPAPTSNRQRRRPPSEANTLLRLVLQHPAWAARLPVDLIPTHNAEGQALVAIIDLSSTGDLAMNAGLGALVEQFRDTPHAETLARVAGELVDTEFDEDVVEILFEDTLNKLHANALAREIAALTAQERESGLSPMDRHRLAELLLEKMSLVNARKPADV